MTPCNGLNNETINMQYQMKIEINAPASEAWNVLGEGFASISEWDSGLKASSLTCGLMAGGIRTCESSKGFGPFKPGVVKERILSFDPESMTFEYQGVSGLPGFIHKASNRWSIHKLDTQNCMVQFDATIEFRGIMKLFQPFMKLMMKSDIDRFIEELRYRIVNGHPHPNACLLEDSNLINKNLNR
jgi:carbon monoxide dehydrogenase subunit G